MQSAFIDFASSSIHYQYRKGGDKLLLCFHGYAESAESFNFLESEIPDAFSILALDMPYHGSTKWNGDDEIDPIELQNLIDRITAIHELNSFEIIMLGYSMGARVALACFQSNPGNIKQLILLAPDGLKVNFWYWFSTQTRPGKKVFSYTISNPGWFIAILKTANAMRLLNPSVYKFVLYFVHDEEMRRQLYLRWTVLNQFLPRLSLIKKLMASGKVACHLIYGRYDRIILYSVGERFQNGIEKNCTIELVDAGHQLLQEKYISYILKHLKY